MTVTALYPGSFDPLTKGHVEIIRSALRLCDALVIAIGVHPTKTPLLPAADRAALIETVARPLADEAGRALRVLSFAGLAVDAARDVGASLIVRGLRSGTDFEDEVVMAGMNRDMAPELQTVFLPATPQTRHITGTMVRQVAAMGGDVSAFVPAAILAALAGRGPKG